MPFRMVYRLAMQMLLPFKSVWFSLILFRPCGVISLQEPH